jgi:hypothetical protein
MMNPMLSASVMLCVKGQKGNKMNVQEFVNLYNAQPDEEKKT